MSQGNYFSPFSLRVQEELVNKLKYIADINKRSANKEMEFILQSYVNDWEKNNQVINIDLND